uniref:Uncharacterized protein n=2 Tax=Palpitomonas bilix TaxID=652834 RepID=A0A7S3CV14_9EUKA|mmetsp:Transcript_10269/g.26913  ORF Transcript_10269/g.26913 Transcript_10269/m.26913 type:complete len:166 (+) Transcript_10269:178-675(+)|eukprot:CAMPEP_0113882286 /NCGR_PEP_ID=MMETSP0780_2-20120614/8865_1 /TAXON_ID=652834 /ORGANISM="Palpitomonas bilix" /LENGTH=165 /DNA_ID=CAMNT_0000869273 /DNA_START=135 /DNA_END=632 /DNA_ORIENTATION=- /assembly_acc=CAM_ASM_000599
MSSPTSWTGSLAFEKVEATVTIYHVSGGSEYLTHLSDRINLSASSVPDTNIRFRNFEDRLPSHKAALAVLQFAEGCRNEDKEFLAGRGDSVKVYSSFRIDKWTGVLLDSASFHSFNSQLSEAMTLVNSSLQGSAFIVLDYDDESETMSRKAETKAFIFPVSQAIA